MTTERDKPDRPYGWARISNEATVLRNLREMGGVVIDPSKIKKSQAGFRDPGKPQR